MWKECKIVDLAKNVSNEHTTGQECCAIIENDIEEKNLDMKKITKYYFKFKNHDEPICAKYTLFI